MDRFWLFGYSLVGYWYRHPAHGWVCAWCATRGDLVRAPVDDFGDLVPMERVS